jgi:hypothetical protein
MRAETKKLPPKISPALSPIFFAGVVLTAAMVGVGAMVFFFNPATHPFYPVCMFHAVTGLNCPGCGATRALYALLHGNFALAFKDNALFVCALAALAVLGERFALKKIKQQPATLHVSPFFLWSGLAVALIFTVVRNLPGFEWLSP